MVEGLGNERLTFTRWISRLQKVKHSLVRVKHHRQLVQVHRLRWDRVSPYWGSNDDTETILVDDTLIQHFINAPCCRPRVALSICAPPLGLDRVVWTLVDRANIRWGTLLVFDHLLLLNGLFNLFHLDVEKIHYWFGWYTHFELKEDLKGQE